MLSILVYLDHFGPNALILFGFVTRDVAELIRVIELMNEMAALNGALNNII